MTIAPKIYVRLDVGYGGASNPIVFINLDKAKENPSEENFTSTLIYEYNGWGKPFKKHRWTGKEWDTGRPNG